MLALVDPLREVDGKGPLTLDELESNLSAPQGEHMDALFDALDACIELQLLGMRTRRVEGSPRHTYCLTRRGRQLLAASRRGAHAA